MNKKDYIKKKQETFITDFPDESKVLSLEDYVADAWDAGAKFTLAQTPRTSFEIEIEIKHVPKMLAKPQYSSDKMPIIDIQELQNIVNQLLTMKVERVAIDSGHYNHNLLRFISDSTTRSPEMNENYEEEINSL